MSQRKAKLCRYCRVEVGAGGTIDHVVPKWVARLLGGDLPVLKSTANRVTACNPCNKLKGPMPVQVFLQYRFDHRELKQHRNYWTTIAGRVTSGSAQYIPGSRRAGHPIRETILKAFNHPIPEHFVTGTRPISVKYADGPAPDFVRGQ